MTELETAERHSSDLLNRIIDHAHLTGRDYLMALEETRARDAAVELQASRKLLSEIRAYVAAGGTPSPDIEALLSFLDAAYAEPATGQKEAP